MKFTLALLVVGLFQTSAEARSWPHWIPTHVTEIRFRDGLPGEQLRVVSDRSEIDTILQIFRRAKEVRKRDSVLGNSQVCFDMIGQRPESGRWLLNLDTGVCTFLDPWAQPIYQLPEEDRQLLKTYFRRKEKDDNPSLQPTPRAAVAEPKP